MHAIVQSPIITGLEITKRMFKIFSNLRKKQKVIAEMLNTIRNENKRKKSLAGNTPPTCEQWSKGLHT